MSVREAFLVAEDAREFFGRPVSMRAAQNDSGDREWFVEVLGDVSDDRDWAKLVEFHKREKPENIHVVLAAFS